MVLVCACGVLTLGCGRLGDFAIMANRSSGIQPEAHRAVLCEFTIRNDAGRSPLRDYGFNDCELPNRRHSNVEFGKRRRFAKPPRLTLNRHLLHRKHN